MNKFIIVSLLLFTASLAFAQENKIKFPIEELGNCSSKAECKTYCDNPGNQVACLSFAEKNNLMSKDELTLARKMAAGEIKGPGGCTSQESCEKYCDNLSRIEECLSFAEANDLIPPEELKEAQRIRDAIKQGVKPPACNNKRDCESYCQKPGNMEVCMNFALKAGLMDENERAQAEKMLEAIKKGFKPPACGGREECEQYCTKEENIKECSDFAIASGMMSEEEFKKINEGSKDFREALRSAPEEVKSCIVERLGKDVSQISPGPASGAALRDCYEKYKPKGDEQYGPGEPGAERGERRTGPGGCQNREECDAYCRSNPDECRPFGEERMPPEGYERSRMPQQFVPPEGRMMPPPDFRGEAGQFPPVPPNGEVPPPPYERSGSPEQFTPPEGSIMPSNAEVPPTESTSPAPEPASEPQSTSEPASQSSLPKFLQAALVIFGAK